MIGGRERSSLLAKCTQKAKHKSTRNQSKISTGRGPGAAKIESKLDPGLSRDTPRRPGASRRRLGSVSGRSRRAPGAPGVFPRGPRDAKKDARKCPGARRGDQNRRQVAPGSEKIEFFSHDSLAKHGWSDFSSIFVDFRFFRKVRNVCFVPRLPAKTEGRPFALRV